MCIRDSRWAWFIGDNRQSLKLTTKPEPYTLDRTDVYKRQNGNTNVVEVTAGTVYIKEVSAPAGYKVDKTVYSLKAVSYTHLDVYKRQEH